MLGTETTVRKLLKYRCTLELILSIYVRVMDYDYHQEYTITLLLVTIYILRSINRLFVTENPDFFYVET